jgi:hypothetical protein
MGMRKAILTVLGVLFASNATAMNAKGLAHACTNDLLGAATYITGFLDTWSENDMAMVIVGAYVSDKESLKVIRHALVGKFCIPEKTSTALAIRIGCDWVETHPDKGDLTAPRALFAAYNAAWPCLSDQ